MGLITVTLANKHTSNGVDAGGSTSFTVEAEDVTTNVLDLTTTYKVFWDSANAGSTAALKGVFVINLGAEIVYLRPATAVTPTYMPMPLAVGGHFYIPARMVNDIEALAGPLTIGARAKTATSKILVVCVFI